MSTDVNSGEQPRPATRSQRGWWRRNWLWFVPSVCVLLVVLCAAGVVGTYLLMLRAIKSTEPYQMALEKVQNDPRVIAAIGEPINDISWYPAGEVRQEGDRGSAQLDFDVAGPEGTAHVRVEARCLEGQWGLLRLEATPDGGSAIKFNVREAGGGSEAPRFVPTPSAKDEKPPAEKKSASESPDTTINLPVPEP